MSKKSEVLFNKGVIFNGKSYIASIKETFSHTTQTCRVVYDIEVIIRKINRNRSIIHIFNGKFPEDDKNRYVKAIKDAFQEYHKYQFETEEAKNLHNWDGNIEEEKSKEADGTQKDIEEKLKENGSAVYHYNISIYNNAKKKEDEFAKQIIQYLKNYDANY